MFDNFAKLERDGMSSRLPIPLAGMTTDVGTAPNKEGDIGLAIYINGGCLGPYTQSIDTTSGITQYVCSSLSDSNFVFDPHFTMVEERRSMPRKRHRHTSATVNGFIWVLGGLNEEGTLISEVDVYDTQHDVWVTLRDGLENVKIENSDMSFDGLYDSTAVAIGEHIFVMGGFNKDHTALDINLVIHAGLSMQYNRLVYSWKNQLGVARGGASSTVIKGNEIVIAGGFSDVDGFCQALSSVERYDPLSESWFIEESMQFGRSYFSLFMFENKLFAMGGERRGEFRSLSGVCIDGEEGNTLELNQKTPDRILFPVNVVEVLDLSLIQKYWRTMDNDMILGHRSKYSTVPWQTTKSLFSFGGVEHEKSSAMQGMNYILHDEIVLCSLQSKNNDSVAVLIVFGLLVAILAFTYLVKKKMHHMNYNSVKMRGNAVHAGNLQMQSINEDGRSSPC